MGLERHYGMDWLRIGAFGVLIFYHIGMVFVPWPFHAKAAQPIDWLTVPMQAPNAWRLSLLFVVSGYASRAIFAKRPNAPAFAWARTKRLIPPLLFGVALIAPAQPWIELSTQHGYARGFWHFLTHDYFRFTRIGGITLPNWQHLWFIAYLWIYTLLVSLALLIPARIRSAVAHGAGVVLAGPLILIVPTALLIANWAWSFPGVAETHALIDDWQVHRVYLPMFLFGFLLRDSMITWRAIRWWWPLGLALGVVAYAYVAWLEATFLGRPMGRTLWFAFGCARAVQSWGMILGLIGIADRWLNRDHPARAMLNEAVFPFYLIHQTIIVVVAGGLLRLGVGPIPEFLVLLAATIAGCWGFYRIGREIGWLRPLIGLRARRAIAGGITA